MKPFRQRPGTPGILLIFLLLIFNSGCEPQKKGVAAPLNEVASLEKLAAAYEKLSEQVPVSPVNLAPKARKKFVVQVFEEAGYGYSETLTSLSKVNRNQITKLHRDIQELLFLPHYGFQRDIIKEIYTEQEQRDIELIISNLK